MNKTETTYFEPSYFQRLRAMAQGLRQPQGTREYKAAIIELQRLSAPLTAMMMPLVVAMLLMVLNAGNSGADRTFVVDYLEIEEFRTLEPLEPEKPVERSEIKVEVEVEVASTNVEDPTPVEPQMVNPEPPQIETVLWVTSPTIFPGLIGTRDPTERGGRIGIFNPVNGKVTEAAVVRALRWLKLRQNTDGSWDKHRTAMTALAVLAFLAHDETPDSRKSPEFCETVEKALEYLLSQQKEDGRFMGVDEHDYSHPIATYALAEAFGMTRHPNVKTAVEKALVPIIKGQHPTGGWTYNMNPGLDDAGKYRDDISYMGWCVQALKAAKLAGIQVEGLDKATKLAVRGFKGNASPAGGFGYTSQGVEGMTAVGTLCLQLLGAAGDRDVKLALDKMKVWKPTFSENEPNVSGHNNSPQYYYYYATQAKFHAYADSSPEWAKWNTAMTTLYVAEQKIMRGAIKDAKGEDQDVGWWENKDNHTDRPVMDTCLAVLQLMVYYRYLPTTQAEAVEAPQEIAGVERSDDIPITIDI